MAPSLPTAFRLRSSIPSAMELPRKSNDRRRSCGAAIGSPPADTSRARKYAPGSRRITGRCTDLDAGTVTARRYGARPGLVTSSCWSPDRAGSKRNMPLRSMEAVTRPPSVTTTVPPDTGVPSGASTYPVRPTSSTPPDDCARGVAPATSRSSGIAASGRVMIVVPLRSGVPSSGEVAQLVEHTTENRSVDGSIPPLATTS